MFNVYNLLVEEARLLGCLYNCTRSAVHRGEGAAVLRYRAAVMQAREHSVRHGEGVITMHGNRGSAMRSESYHWEQSVSYEEGVIPMGTVFQP